MNKKKLFPSPKQFVSYVGLQKLLCSKHNFVNVFALMIMLFSLKLKDIFAFILFMHFSSKFCFSVYVHLTVMQQFTLTSF